MFQIKMYNNLSIPTVIDKVLTEELILNGVLNNKVNEYKPFIAIKFDDYKQFSRLNYMKTDMFGDERSYFLSSSELHGSIAYCLFELDVVSTFKNELINGEITLTEISENYSDQLKYVNRPTTVGETITTTVKIGSVSKDHQDVLITGGD